MKKIWMLLLSIFVMYGCGSGGAGSTSGTPAGSPGSSSVSGQPANFTLTLNDGVAASSTSMHALAMDPAEPATSARVVIRKVTTIQVPIYDVDEEGNPTGDIIGYQNVDTEIYRRVADAVIIGGQVSVTAPVSASPTDYYIFDVLTYIPGTPNTMLTFGHNPSVAVIAGQGATINMFDICADPGVSLSDPAKLGSVSMQIPPSIISEQAYSVTADAKTPVRRGYYELGIALSNSVPTTPSLAGTYALSSNPLILSGTRNLTAPYTINALDTSLNFSVKYFISEDMLDPTKTPRESYKDWVRIYPNNVGTVNETLQSTLTPLVSINVPTN